MTSVQEFNDCWDTAMDIDVPPTWQDDSYRNDASPSYFCNGCKIWVATELGIKGGEKFAPFTVCLLDHQHDFIEFDEDGQTVNCYGIEFDKLEDVVEFVEDYNDPYKVQRILEASGLCLTEAGSVNESPRTWKMIYKALDSLVTSRFDTKLTWHWDEETRSQKDVTWNDILVEAFTYPVQSAIPDSILNEPPPFVYVGKQLTFKLGSLVLPIASSSLDMTQLCDDLNQAFADYWRTRKNK